MNRRMGVLAACAVLALLTGCVSRLVVSQLNLDVTVEKPFVIQKTPYQMAWGYCTFPYMADYGDAGLLVAYNTAGEANYKAEFAAALREGGPAFSMDRGKTWQHGMSRIREIGSPLAVYRDVNTIRNGDRMMVFQSQTTFSGPYHSLPYGVFEGGRWVETGRLAAVSCPLTKRAVYVCSKGFTAPDGTMMLCAWTHFANDSHVSSLLLCSTNGGRHWDTRSIIAKIDDCRWGIEGPCEPAICLTKSGDILAVMRTGGGGESGTSVGTSMLSARSSDGGRTWTHRRLSFPGVMPKLINLSNGMIALSYGRPGNNLRFSRDDGHSWGGEIAFTSFDQKTTGYCDILEVEPGRILAVYDLMNHMDGSFWLWEPPPALNYIFGVFVNVK